MTRITMKLKKKNDQNNLRKKIDQMTLKLKNKKRPKLP